MKKPISFTCLILILLTLFLGCGNDDSDENYKKRRQLTKKEEMKITGINAVGVCSFSGFAVDVCVVNKYAYVADETFGVRIIDVSDPRRPNEISNFQTQGKKCRGIYVVGKFAYITDDRNLYILDISDPVNPQEMSVFNSCGSGVFVVGNYAYFTAGGNAIIINIIDVSNPRKPQQVIGQGMEASHGRPLYIVGNRAYISRDHADYMLKVIDISDIKNPQLIGFSHLGGDGLYVVGNYVYMVTDQGLVIFDVSDPRNPTMIGQRDTLYHPTSVLVSGKYAYVTANVSGLYVMDISDPKNPRIIIEQKTIRAVGACVVNEYVYVADGEGGLLILKCV